MNFYRVLSDLILMIHFGFVAFIVVGFIVIWLGYFCGWSVVRGPAFRIVHVLAIAIVVLESCAGLVCPLTEWEDQLRAQAGQDVWVDQSFMQRWIGSLLFYDSNEHLFTMIYAGFFVLVVLTFLLVPPRRAWK